MEYRIIAVFLLFCLGLALFETVERLMPSLERVVTASRQVDEAERQADESLRDSAFQNGVRAGAAVGMAQCAKSADGKQFWLNLVEEMKKNGLIRDQAMIDRLLKDVK